MKICIVSDPDNYGQGQISTVKRLHRELGDFEIAFVNSAKDADILLVHHNQLQPDYANRCIVVERADSSVVTLSRNLLKKQSVLGMFKHTLIEPCLNNVDFCKKRYHYKVLRDWLKFDIDVERPVQLSLEDLDKLHCAIPIVLHKRFDVVRGQSFSKERSIDVVCCSGEPKGCKILSLHRSLAKDQIKSVPNSIVSTNLYGFDQWIDILKNSKICVCPWGYGEMCYRDYEAMFCGCVVIKPYSDFVTTVPQIYKAGITYLPCKPDFSDLQFVCEEVLGNYDKYCHMAQSNMQMLNKTNLKEILAAKFVFSLEHLNVM